MFKPGDVVEFDPSPLEENGKIPLLEYKGLRGIIVRKLGQHENLCNSLDYIVSWDWVDDRLPAFLVEIHGFKLDEFKGNRLELKEILDPRTFGSVLKLSDRQDLYTLWDVEWDKDKTKHQVASSKIP